MSDDLMVTDGLQVVRQEKSLIQIAAEAEKMIDAVKKIREVALKLTNPDDWVDENDKPYLQASGSEKIAGPFGISWIFLNDPIPEVEDDGHFTYCYKGRFSMGGRSIDVDGSRSSKDPFFNKYDYVDRIGADGNQERWPDGNVKKDKVQKPISSIDKRDVKMAAMTNLLGNGITRILGIRNLTWGDLESFAKIKKEQVRGFKYGKGGEKGSIKEPQKKSTDKTEQSTEAKTVITPILNVTKKDGVNKETKKPWVKFSIFGHLDGNETAFNTFSQSFADMAAKEKETGAMFEITYEKTQYGCDIKDLKAVEPGPDENAQ